MTLKAPLGRGELLLCILITPTVIYQYSSNFKIIVSKYSEIRNQERRVNEGSDDDCLLELMPRD